MAAKSFFITTAIDYTNAAPHLGHAYEKVLADTLVRWRRLCGVPAYFLTGVDQHGQKVQMAAQREGIEPSTYAARETAKFLALWETLGLSNDGWAETTHPAHKRVVQGCLQKLYSQGELYKASYSGFYSVRQEQFLTDKDRLPDGTFGTEWGQVVELAEDNWYFPLTKHKDWLVRLLKSRQLVFPDFRQQELLNAAEKISCDLCISRPRERLSWGIPLPFDENYVTYVWFDALINYISFAGYRPMGETGAEFDGLPTFNSLWPADFHLIGKDILIPAHGIYWLIMLHALGFTDEQMPGFLVHGFWNMGGARMSKSTGNIADPATLATQYSPDALRYYLMRDIATGQDADFNAERLILRYNADLANDLGNLVNRTLSMANRYRAGILQPTSKNLPFTSELAKAIVALPERVATEMERHHVHAALEAINELVTRCNGFIEIAAPWKLAKDPSPEASSNLDATLGLLTDAIRILAILISPVLPRPAAEIISQLGLEPSKELVFQRAKLGLLPEGHRVGTPRPVFPRIESAESSK